MNKIEAMQFSNNDIADFSIANVARIAETVFWSANLLDHKYDMTGEKKKVTARPYGTANIVASVSRVPRERCILIWENHRVIDVAIFLQ